MNNPLKRQSSIDDATDSQSNNKRQKPLYTEFLSPNLKPSADLQSLLASHFPPSPPILVDIPSPLPTTSASHTPSTSITDSTPTLKTFTITTRHQQDQNQQQQEYTPSDYANINQILHEAHFQRHGTSSTSIDLDMMDCDNDNDDSNYYNYTNTILRQAFLQRHSSPPY